MQAAFDGFFRGKTVMLTGQTGFKGAWLAIWLREMGAKVIGYALPPETNPSLFLLAGLQGRINSINGDIRDLYNLASVIDRSCPEIIFHLAAQSLVSRSYKEAVETFGSNVMGVVNLLEACRNQQSVRAIVIVTSDKCYENRESGEAYSEEDRLGGRDPYSSSKACAEIVTASYRYSFFSKEQGRGLASARAGNVIGGGDWSEDRLVPDCLKSLEKSETIIVRNPGSVRPWQHVLEPLSGYLSLAERLYNEPAAFSDAWNFGPSESACVAVQALVESIIEKWGSGDWKRPDTEQSFKEACTLRLESSKASRRLGWKPRWDIGTAVTKTVQWHKAYLDGADIYRLCCRQIDEYMQV
jgi:CDP-glucose 4,6-dehydratase